MDAEDEWNDEAMLKQSFKEIGKLSRNKGKTFEQKTARAFRDIFPDARRHLENHKEDAAKGVDLINTGPYLVQCKRLRGYAPIQRIHEIAINKGSKQVPVLVTQGDHTEVMAVLPLTKLLELIKLAEAKRKD